MLCMYTFYIVGGKITEIDNHLPFVPEGYADFRLHLYTLNHVSSCIDHMQIEVNPRSGSPAEVMTSSLSCKSVCHLDLFGVCP